MVKKIITTILLITVIITIQAQIQPGRYKILYAENQLQLQQKPDFEPRLAIDNQPTTANESLWDIKQVSGKRGYYFIQNVASKKCITWVSPTSGNQQLVNVVVNLTAQLPIRDIQKQSFKFESLEDGYYQMVPDNGVTSSAYLFALGTVSATGPNSTIGCVNMNGIPKKIFTWQVVPAREVSTSNNLDLQKKIPAVALVESDNKIEVDIKTGSDNLEPKSTQHNAELRVIVQGRADVIKTNINEGKEWPNNSTKRITLPLPADITADDIKEVHIYRKKDGLQYVWQLGEKDNWNIDRVTVNATIKKDGVKKRTLLLETGAYRPRIPGNNNLTNPLFRFIYEGGDNVNEGQVFKLKMAAPVVNVRPVTPNPATNISMLAVFGIGGDDLRGGGDNLNLTIRFKSAKPDIFCNNVNASKNWKNFSDQSFRKVLMNTNDLDFNDIKEVELRHTGGGGIGADNCYLDKFKVIFTRGDETKVLIDRVEAPIHYFTGDTRRKTFIIQ